jgi:hypothetical protein
VATFSTGVSVTWGGSAFSEVVGLDWTYGGGAPKGRSVVWTDDAGSVSVTALDSANTSTAEYGLRKQLVISGGGQSLTNYAIWESLSVSNEVDGVTRYTVTFKLLDN